MKKSTRKTPPKQVQLFIDIIDELADLTTQETKDLALDAGVHFTTLYAWRRGKTWTPRLDCFVRVASALGYELVLQKRRSTLRLVSNG